MDLLSRAPLGLRGLTGLPVLLTPKILQGCGPSADELAAAVSLSQATLTEIVNRLVMRGLIKRARDVQECRRMLVHAMSAGLTVLEQSPLLQERFA